MMKERHERIKMGKMKFEGAVQCLILCTSLTDIKYNHKLKFM